MLISRTIPWEQYLLAYKRRSVALSFVKARRHGFVCLKFSRRKLTRYPR